MLQCFECSNVIEIHNGIMFDFYPGLPHIIFMIGTIAAVLLTSIQTMTTAGFCYSCIIICGLVQTGWHGNQGLVVHRCRGLRTS